MSREMLPTTPSAVHTSSPHARRATATTPTGDTNGPAFALVTKRKRLVAAATTAAVATAVLCSPTALAAKGEDSHIPTPTIVGGSDAHDNDAHHQHHIDKHHRHTDGVAVQEALEKAAGVGAEAKEGTEDDAHSHTCSHGHDHHSHDADHHHHHDDHHHHDHGDGSSCPHAHHHHQDHHGHSHDDHDHSSCPHHDHNHHHHDDDEHASCPHAHHHHHHHDHDDDHDHHDHLSSTNAYDWVATITDKASGALLVADMPVLMSDKVSGIVRFTPKTYEQTMKFVGGKKEGGGGEGQQKQPMRIVLSDADGANATVLEDVSTTGAGTTEEQQQKDSSSPTSSDRLVASAFYYTVPCGGMCEDAYQLYISASTRLHSALERAIEKVMGRKNADGGVESADEPGTKKKQKKSAVEDASEAATNGTNSTAATTTSEDSPLPPSSLATKIRKFLQQRFLLGQFEVPRREGSKTHHGGAYGGIVKEKGPNGTSIEYDFPLITIATSGSAVSAIRGYTGPLTAGGLWYDGVRPQLIALHADYCGGLRELDWHLVEAEGAEKKKKGSSSSSSSSRHTSAEIKSVLAAVPDHDLWQAFCAALDVSAEKEVGSVVDDDTIDGDGDDTFDKALRRAIGDAFRDQLAMVDSVSVVEEADDENDAVIDHPKTDDTPSSPPSVNTATTNTAQKQQTERFINVSDYDFEDGVLKL